jgi:glycosyltransferase involved in cell wall biosynthesis
MRLLSLAHAHPHDMRHMWNGSHAFMAHLFDALVTQGNSLVIGYCKMNRLETLISAAWSLARFGRIDRVFITQNRLAWHLKSRRAQRYVRRYLNDIDMVFLSHGLFSPYLDRPFKPYAVFTDYNYMLRYQRSSFLMPAPWTNERDKTHLLAQEKALFQNAELVFVPTQYVRKSMLEDYDLCPDQVVVVGYGLTGEISQEAPERDWHSQRLIFIGEPKSFARKGGPELIAAFKQLRSQLPDATLTMIGPTEQMTGTIPGLRALGFVQDRSQIKTLLAESTCFVMPTQQEPFGIVFLEAMAARLPVISTCVDGVPEIVVHGQTGLLVPPGDIDALTAALYQMLTQPDMARQMGEAGFQRQQDRFTWGKVAQRINEALLTLSANEV